MMSTVEEGFSVLKKWKSSSANVMVSFAFGGPNPVSLSRTILCKMNGKIVSLSEETSFFVLQSEEGPLFSAGIEDSTVVYARSGDISKELAPGMAFDEDTDDLLIITHSSGMLICLYTLVELEESAAV